MTWWIWIILGLFVFVLELFVPSGFFLFIIGLSGVLTGLLTLTQLIPTVWLQCFVCALIATALMVGIRKKMVARLGVPSLKRGGSVYGSTVLISSDDIPAGKDGVGELRGTVWTVRNAGTAVLKKGESYKIDSMEGVTLIVKG